MPWDRITHENEITFIAIARFCLVVNLSRSSHFAVHCLANRFFIVNFVSFLSVFPVETFRRLLTVLRFPKRCFGYVSYTSVHVGSEKPFVWKSSASFVHCMCAALCYFRNIFDVHCWSFAEESGKFDNGAGLFLCATANTNVLRLSYYYVGQRDTISF